MSNWPCDKNGNPMAKVSWSLAGRHSLGKNSYSNVEFGPGVVERFVEDTPESVANGIARCQEEVEKGWSEQRKDILEVIKKQDGN